MQMSRIGRLVGGFRIINVGDQAFNVRASSSGNRGIGGTLMLSDAGCTICRSGVELADVERREVSWA